MSQKIEKLLQISVEFFSLVPESFDCISSEKRIAGLPAKLIKDIDLECAMGLILSYPSLTCNKFKTKRLQYFLMGFVSVPREWPQMQVQPQTRDSAPLPRSQPRYRKLGVS